MKTTLLLDDLDEIIANVIATLQTREMNVRDRGGIMYSLRIRPYKTTDQKIDGAVLTLVKMRG